MDISTFLMVIVAITAMTAALASFIKAVTTLSVEIHRWISRK